MLDKFPHYLKLLEWKFIWPEKLRNARKNPFNLSTEFLSFELIAIIPSKQH